MKVGGVEKLKGIEFGERAFLVAKVEAATLKGIRRYLEDKGFTEIVVPHITKATGACENIATMFELEYFGRHAYLTQTGQLYLEVLTPFLEKVWCTIHSFRAEPDIDDRHLTEFVLVELEFLGDFEMLLRYIEEAVYAGVYQAFRDAREELEQLGVDLGRLKSYIPPYQRITYTQAVEELAEYGVGWGNDLKSFHEKMLVEMHGNKPLFITHYPKEIKFFNMRENPDDPRIVNSADLILPYSGEAVGAAEREYRYERLLERLLSSTMYEMLVERGGSIEDFEWYLDFWRKHGGRLHSGCGIGVSRLVQSILGISDIRKATVYPMNRATLY